MPIFQKSITNKYLKSIDNDKVSKAFVQYQKFYGNKLRLYNILHLKEENYQEGFLREIFVQVLGYTIRPDLNYNLTTEYKNQTDSKKADGAIIKKNSAIGVIELKSTKTVNLESIKNQAFNYKHNQPDCRYVITSNFHHLRFYIDNSTEYEEFDLFELTEKEFKLFYLILSQESIFNEIPLKMKEETKFHEESISQKSYKDYKQFRDKIFNNLLENNPQYDKLTLFKKTQKLLDRFIFIWFAEDCGLVTPNLIANVIQKWKNILDNDEYFSLYSRFQKTFNYLDVGYTFQKTIYPAFNGGLFHYDEILDNPNLKIDDNVLIHDCLKISAYDFNTELDVNILGHIFEHSLNEIEEIAAELKGETIEKSKSKRKKEGIFYTPKYITNYIIENTIGNICKAKQIELQINEIEISETFKKNEKITKQGKELYIKFQEYKSWLLSLKILDPACGSGAFLNAALDFLINEHKQIDDLISDLTGDKIRMFNTDKTILESNIFGVDLNDESVDIAKLSLWLRTAKRDRKLSDLNNNIKCGNSLIDNHEIAKDKAFNWSTEFSGIMQNGGFDIVIGNPPYFNIHTYGVGSPIFDYLKSDYSEVYQEKSDILFYFIKKAFDISQNYVSFIVSNAFLFSDKAQRLRNWLLENADIVEIVNFEQYLVFQDASITSLIITLRKGKYSGSTNVINFKDKNINPDIIANQIKTKTESYTVSFEKNKPWALAEINLVDIYKKIDNSHLKLEDIMLVGSGMQTAANEVFLFENIPANIPEKYFKKRISGISIDKYYINEKTDYLLYFEFIQNFEELPQSIKTHLLQHKEFLENRATVKNENRVWWRYSRPMHKEYYNLPKLFCSYRASSNAFVYDAAFEYICLTNGTVVFETNKDFSVKYILCLLNSKLLTFRYKSIGKQTGSGIYEYFAVGVGKLPIPAIDKSKQQKFIEFADTIMDLKKKLNLQINQVLESINDNLKCKITEILKTFYKFDFKMFLLELSKQKIKISLADQNEWKNYIVNNSKEINNLLYKITEINNEINNNVYQLYELTPEEITIIES